MLSEDVRLYCKASVFRDASLMVGKVGMSLEGGILYGEASMLREVGLMKGI